MGISSLEICTISSQVRVQLYLCDPSRSKKYKDESWNSFPSQWPWKVSCAYSASSLTLFGLSFCKACLVLPSLLHFLVPPPYQHHHHVKIVLGPNVLNLFHKRSWSNVVSTRVTTWNCPTDFTMLPTHVKSVVESTSPHSQSDCKRKYVKVQAIFRPGRKNVTWEPVW